MELTVETYMKRLVEISHYKGVPYGRVQLILEEEAAYGVQVAETAKGYLALSDAFKSFYMETVERLNTECVPQIKTPPSEQYPLFVVRLNHNFQSLVAAERVALNGYPLQAYQLHRNNFDNALLTAGALLKLTDFYAIEGIEPGKPFDPKNLKKQRQKAEWAVQDVMLGKESGLSAEAIKEIRKLGDTFDYEVHGARLSLAAAMGWMKGTEPLSVVPKFKLRDIGLHINRFVEIGWIVHRMIPAIQPPDALLGDDWKDKWQVLDEMFEATVAALTEECGKKIGAAMVEFVRTKLPFTARSSFPL